MPPGDGIGGRIDINAEGAERLVQNREEGVFESRTELGFGGERKTFCIAVSNHPAGIHNGKAGTLGRYQFHLISWS